MIVAITIASTTTISFVSLLFTSPSVAMSVRAGAYYVASMACGMYRTTAQPPACLCLSRGPLLDLCTLLLSSCLPACLLARVLLGFFFFFCQHVLFFAHRRVSASLLFSFLFSPLTPLPDKPNPCCTVRSFVLSRTLVSIGSRLLVLYVLCRMYWSTVCHAFGLCFVTTRRQFTVLIPRTATLPFS